jgi:hypothetical protein
MESSRNKQLAGFKSHAILNSVMKSHAIPISPSQDVCHPFVQCTYTTCLLVI